MAHSTYRQYQKKQRSRVLAVQAALGVSIAALTAGVGYASLCIVRGQAALPGLPQALAAWLPFSQSAGASGLSAAGTAAALDTETGIAPVTPAQDAEAETAPAALDPDAEAGNTPAAPAPDAEAETAPAAPAQNAEAGTAPAAPDPDAEAGNAPAAPTPDAEAETAPAVPTPDAEADIAPAAPAPAVLPAVEQEAGAGAAALSGAWNTAEPIADSVLSVSDPRLLAVPENGCLSDDYFRDALFIGDSVTQGFGVYPEYKDWMRVCAYKGIGPQSILQNMVGQRPDNTSIEMWDDIKVQQNVANIYVLFGANALLAQSDEAFLKYYGDLLDRLCAQFPGVPIYVQSLTPTTLAYGQKRPALARDHLRSINEAVAQMAVSKGMYYVDLWEALADEEGYLREDLSGDGLHLHDGSKYRPWLDYLATHTVYSAHNAQFALEEGGAYS